MKIEQVVVGGCVYALMKSYTDTLPIVLTSNCKPTIDLKFESNITIEQLQTDKHIEAWLMLKFLCGMRGLIINANSLEYVKVSEDLISFNNVEIEFSKCHLFPDSVIKNELEIISIEDENLYKILDFMRLKFCDASNLVPVFPKEVFISTIEATSKKELYALSYLTKEQLTDFEFSDTMARFIVERELQQRTDLHRPLIVKNGTARRKPKLEVMDRVVLQMQELVYKSTKKVKFYDRKKRSNIIETYSRDNTSFQSSV